MLTWFLQASKVSKVFLSSVFFFWFYELEKNKNLEKVTNYFSDFFSFEAFENKKKKSILQKKIWIGKYRKKLDKSYNEENTFCSKWSTY